MLSDAITKKMDKEERKYQKAIMICVQGIGAALTKGTEALDIIDGMGESHHDSLRSTKWEMWQHKSVNDVLPAIPWASVIQQTLSHQDVPEYFQKDETMRHTIEILDEEEVLQRTTCTPKGVYTDIKGWTTAFEVELFSLLTLDVKIDVHEDTLDLGRITILPGKAVMVKKPSGDGTHKKKARVVVCGKGKKHAPILHHFRCYVSLSRWLHFTGGPLRTGTCQLLFFTLLFQKDRRCIVDHQMC